MPRPLRIEYEGAIYHVMNRGDRREPIVRDDKWLNRRSQKRSYTWNEFDALIRRSAIPLPRIVEPRYQPTLL